MKCKHIKTAIFHIRSYAYSKDDSGADIEISRHVFAEGDKKMTYCSSGAAALPPQLFTTRPEYDMPKLENLSVKGDVKEQNFGIRGQGLNYDPVIPLCFENQREDFDDGIPKLPDLGWVSDQGDVDPMNRLYKAESAVSDLSKQDLMSDL